MVTENEISLLFKSVQNIINHQQQIEKLKGESFNIFSILKMDRLENRTHSAFITELLNPNGSHLKGNVFLNLFLSTVQLSNHININSAWVKPEFYIGEVDLKNKRGGRLDIFIADKSNNCISIENKIDAEDKEAQIERYCNYQKQNNKVIYLTLQGKLPDKISCGELRANTDFQILSYKVGIKQWLELCIKETADSPILRETIKQYLILINKMTSTPDKTHEIELINLIKNNLESATFIANNLLKAKQLIGDEIRNAVLAILKQRLPNDIDCALGYSIDQRFAQVWIWLKQFHREDVYFGMESFNGTGNFNGDFFIGIFNKNGLENDFTKSFNAKPEWWYKIEKLTYEGVAINFGDNNLLLNILKSQEYKTNLIEYIVSETLSYLDKNKQCVFDYLKNKEKNG